MAVFVPDIVAFFLGHLEEALSPSHSKPQNFVRDALSALFFSGVVYDAFVLTNTSNHPPDPDSTILQDK